MMAEQESRPTLRLSQPAGSATSDGAKVLRTNELFARGQEVTIEHHGDLYRLRETSKGRLILTK